MSLMSSYSCKETTSLVDTSTMRSIANDTPDYIKAIEKAHEVEDFYGFECVSFDLLLTFGGKENFRGRVSTMANSSAIRLDYADGRKLLYNNGEVWTAAAPSNLRKDRFALFTWQYFFMVPYKLRDKGTQWSHENNITIADKEYDSYMLTFKKKTGDAPDDWYMIHPDPATNLIHHVGYIVTGGVKSAEEVEDNAHALTYTDYRNVEGIPFPHKWIFSNYSRVEGVQEEIGNAIISDIRLGEAKDTFDPKTDPLFLKYGRDDWPTTK